MEKELTLVSYTNKEMFFRKIPKNGPGSEILSDWKVTREEMNKIIQSLNKISYRIMEEFRDIENKDFLAGYINFNRWIFLPVLVSAILMYTIMNLHQKDAR